MAPSSPGLAAHGLSCYTITMLSPFSLTAGVGRRVGLTVPLLVALWALVAWAMA